MDSLDILIYGYMGNLLSGQKYLIRDTDICMVKGNIQVYSLISIHPCSVKLTPGTVQLQEYSQQLIFIQSWVVHQVPITARWPEVL